MLAGMPFAALPLVLGAGAWPVVVAGWLIILVAVIRDAALLLVASPRLSVKVPGVVGVGETLEIEGNLVLGGKRSLFVSIRPELSEPLSALPDLADWFDAGENEFKFKIDAASRGTGEIFAVWMQIRGYLGLLNRTERIQLDSGEVKVIPSLVRVRHIAARFFAGRNTGSLRLKRLGDGTELDSIEAYQSGMDLRQVDWKSSARHQALRVRRFRLERNQRIVICLDTGRVSGDRIEGISRLDHSIHSALAMTWVALKGGDLVGLHSYADEPITWVPPRNGMSQMRIIQEACSRVHVRNEETNHVLGMKHLLTRLSRRTLVVVLTEIVDPTSSELMIQQLGYLTGRHLVILVALDDPVVAKALAKPPVEVEELAESVVSGSLMRDREHVLNRLRRAGVNVIHGPPERAALDLLARYIHLKQRRLLG